MARIEKWDEVHGNQAPDERMMAFLDSATDQYAILQLRRIEDTVYERFSSMRELERMGLEPDIDHYEVVYTAPLLPYKDQNTMLRNCMRNSMFPALMILLGIVFLCLTSWLYGRMVL